MPIHVRWLDEAKRILLTEYVGAYTQQENQAAQEHRRLLCDEIDYPVGSIENEMQGYFIGSIDITAPSRQPKFHVYTSRTGFSVQSTIPLNRIAVTIKIPYAQDRWESDESGEIWNTHSREKLRMAFQYPTLESVMVMMTIKVEEAQQIILEYLAQLELSKPTAATV